MNKFLDIARKMKKLWFMRFMVILIVIGAFGMVSKCLKEDWKNWRSEEESTQSNASLLRSSRILRNVLYSRGDLLSLRLQ